MLLKHIFSNVNISNILTHVKKYFNNNHFLHIEESIQKFLVNLDFVLRVVKNMLLFGLIKLPLLSSILSIELYFLPFQKKLENFSFMIELF